jgi:L-2,4-diaminobutyrate decarboxylase
VACQNIIFDDRSALDEAEYAGDLRNAFSAATFNESASVAIEKISELLRRNTVEGVTLEHPELLLEEARGLMRDGEGCDTFDPALFAKIIDLYLRTSIKVSSTGYMARQFSSVVPITAVFDMVTAMAPQPASFYEAGQLANVADKIIAEEFARLIGWETGTSDMVTTSGGSLANLTALLAARNDRLNASWKKGVAQPFRGTPTIAVGEDVHYSVSRVPGIIGIGQDNILRLPLNDRRQICVPSAVALIEAARAAGQDIFCIVASAGSTSTGAIDPLDELADFARANGIWLHVDAAHCGAFLLSDRLRPLLRGIERADSFCIDAHKTLFVPALCTLLFYRDRTKSLGAFTQEASYVFDNREDPMTRFESGAKNFECTKRPAILNLWLVWAMYGPGLIAKKLEYLVDLTRDTYNYLSFLPDFEVVHEPECNILCFEYRPEWVPSERVSALQLALRDNIRAAGKFFISKVELEGRNVLRIVLMNHEINIGHVADLVTEIRRSADEIATLWSMDAVAQEVSR